MAKMRPRMAKMRLKMAKMRPKMAKMKAKMAKMKLKMAKKWLGPMSGKLPRRPASMYACILVLFSWLFAIKTKTSATHWH